MVSSHNLSEIQELCDQVAILDHGKLVLAGPVEAITRGGREHNVVLSRPLGQVELEGLSRLGGIRDIQPVAAADNTRLRKSASYLVTLDLSGDHANEDEVIAAMLRSVLDMGITPRGISQGRSLEAHFLEVTGDATEK